MRPRLPWMPLWSQAWRGKVRGADTACSQTHTLAHADPWHVPKFPARLRDDMTVVGAEHLHPQARNQRLTLWVVRPDRHFGGKRQRIQRVIGHTHARWLGADLFRYGMPHLLLGERLVVG